MRFPGAALVALAACGPNWSSVTYGWVGGQDRVFEGAAWPAGQRAVVADQAARDFNCPADQITVTAPNPRAFVASGCARRGVYVLQTREKSTEGEWERRVFHTWNRAVNVTTPSAPPSTPAGPIQVGAGARGWVALARRGAQDLACPPDQVMPDFVPQGRAPVLPIVEGCGKRATYISETEGPFRLTAVVQMETAGAGAPPAAREAR